jgi:superfamily II DNA or RNA helicase
VSWAALANASRDQAARVQPSRMPTVRLRRAIAGGGLYIPPELVADAARVSSVLSRPSPEYRSWLMRSKRLGKPAGQAPAEKVMCAGMLHSGPWSGGWWLPRYTPVAVDELVDVMVLPEAAAVRALVEPRAYQAQARDAFLAEERGVIVAPCGAGKTTIGVLAIASVATPALVLVHTLDLAKQWVERVKQQLVDCDVGLVGDGKREDEGKRVVVATIQTLSSWSWLERWEWSQRFGLVLLDEAHHAPARTFAEVVASMPGRLRLGLTATPTRADGLTDFLHWSFGPVVYTIDQGSLEAGGATLRPMITWVQTGWKPKTNADDWTHLVDEMAAEPKRNALIVQVVRERAAQGRKVLVLADRVEHCAELATALEGRGLRAAALVGRVSPKKRDELLGKARLGELDAIVATSLADEGLDVPILDTVVLCSPSKNLPRVQQRVGRICRPSPGKPVPEVLDLVDDSAASMRMAWQRFNLYKRLGWTPARPEVR